LLCKDESPEHLPEENTPDRFERGKIAIKIYEPKQNSDDKSKSVWEKSQYLP